MPHKLSQQLLNHYKLHRNEIDVANKTKPDRLQKEQEKRRNNHHHRGHCTDPSTNVSVKNESRTETTNHKSNPATTKDVVRSNR